MGLWRTYAAGRELLDLLRELWRLDEDGLVGGVCGFRIAASDNDFDDGTLHQTVAVSISSILMMRSFSMRDAPHEPAHLNRTCASVP
jgi:hypothetical protein